MKKRVLFKLWMLSFVLIAIFSSVAAKNKDVSDEAELFLSIQHMNLGVLSGREEKSIYLSTIFREKERIQNETLRIVYENAYDFYKKGDFERAKELSARILAIDPDFTDARVLFESSARMRGGRLLTEREILAEKFEEGMRLYSEDRYEEALSKWQEILTIDPKHPQALKWIESVTMELSARYLKAGDEAYKAQMLEHALDNWYRALSLNKNNPELTARIASAESEIRDKKVQENINQALEYRKKGLFMKSYVALEKALEISPGHPKATKLIKDLRIDIAQGYIRAGKKSYSERKYTAAIGHWSKALVWGYNKGYINELIATAKKQMQREDRLKKEQIEKARQAAETAAALEAKKEAEKLQEELQRELEASEEAKRKILSVSDVTEEKKRASEQHYLRGLVHFQNGDYKDAERAWLEALELNPYHSEAEAGLKRLRQIIGPAE